MNSDQCRATYRHALSVNRDLTPSLPFITNTRNKSPNSSRIPVPPHKTMSSHLVSHSCTVCPGSGLRQIFLNSRDNNVCDDVTGGADGTIDIGKWRSSLISIEVALQELAVRSVTEVPSCECLRKVFNLFDIFINKCPVNIRHIINMFKTEFIRAIYSPLGKGSEVNSGGDVGAQQQGISVKDGLNFSNDQVGPLAQISKIDKYGILSLENSITSNMSTPYFQHVTDLQRENSAILEELEIIKAETNIDDINKQLLKYKSLVQFYESEIERLTDENKVLENDLRKATSNMEVLVEKHDQAQNALEEELQRMLRENVELKINIHSLRGEDYQSKDALLTGYNHMKNAKTALLQQLFENGNQDASMLLILHQLEDFLNEAINTTDAEYVKSSEAEAHIIRQKLLLKSVLLLEEMHEVERRRIDLAGRHPESTVARSLLREVNSIGGKLMVEMIINNDISMCNNRDDCSDEFDRDNLNGYSVSSDGAVDRKEEYNKAIQNSNNIITEALFDVVAKTETQKQISNKYDENKLIATKNTPDNNWLAKHCSDTLITDSAKIKSLWIKSAISNLSPQDKICNDFNTAHVDPSAVFNKRVTAPLADISSSKFMCGIELFTQSGPKEEPKYNNTSLYIDPVKSIEIPVKTTHVQLKFKNPLRKDVRTVDGSHLLESMSHSGELRGTIVSRNNILEWLIKRSSEVTQRRKSSLISANSTDIWDNDKRINKLYIEVSKMEGPQWEVYKSVFGEFQPFLPRVIPVEYLDVLMLHAFVSLERRAVSQYNMCYDQAVTKSSSAQTVKMITERAFRELFNKNALQVRLMEVIEYRYVYPELVAKVMYEVLCSLEIHTADKSHTHVYIDCLTGNVSTSHGHLLALFMCQISSCWPGTSLSASEPLNERELPTLMKAVYTIGVWSERFNMEDLLGSITHYTESILSRERIMKYFANEIDVLTEPILKSFHKIFITKAKSVQLAELDYEDFTDVMQGRTFGKLGSETLIRHIYTCCIFDKTIRLPPRELAYIAVLTLWDMARKKKDVIL